MTQQASDGARPLSRSIEFARQRRLPGLLLSVLLAGLGGFMGGVLTHYGPTYLNVYLTQPALTDPAPTPVPPSSSVTEPAPSPAPADEEAVLSARPGGAEARLVVHSATDSFVVLRGQADPQWGLGNMAVENEDMLATTTQDLSEDRVPSDLLAWRDRDVHLYDKGGYACVARVEELQLLQQVAGDYAVQQNDEAHWDSYNDAGLLLVARLASTCPSATWARDASLPPPALARVRNPDKKLRRRALRAFRKSEAWRSIQREYKAEGGAGRWDRFWDQRPTITALRGPEQSLVFVGTQVGGCGEFEANLSMIFEQEADGALTPVARASEDLLLSIEAAADFDGDGDLDLVTRGDGFDRSLVRQGDSLKKETHSAVGIYYCRC